jgi:hypothetical protein
LIIVKKKLPNILGRWIEKLSLREVTNEGVGNSLSPSAVEMSLRRGSGGII